MTAAPPVIAPPPAAASPAGVSATAVAPRAGSPADVVKAPAAGRLRGEGGQVGGIEALPFGLLVFVLGSLLIANAWAVIDAKFATDAAAREAVRTFVESDPRAPDPLTAATEVGLETIAGHGRDRTRATVRPVGEAVMVRCERVTFEAIYIVPALSIPLIGGYGNGPFTVRSTASELVDPFRAGLDGSAEDCFG